MPGRELWETEGNETTTETGRFDLFVPNLAGTGHTVAVETQFEYGSVRSGPPLGAVIARQAAGLATTLLHVPMAHL